MRPTFVPHLVNGVFGDPALYVDCKFEKRGLLFDLGDLKALTPRKMLRVSDIFVSHMHMDHFMGFDWFLRINLGRERTVRLFGPPGFLDQLVAKISAYTWNLVHNYATDLTLLATEVQPDWSTRALRLRCRNAFRPEPFNPPRCAMEFSWMRRCSACEVSFWITNCHVWPSRWRSKHM